MSPLDSSYSVRANSEYSKLVEYEGKHLRTNYMKMTDVFKEETNKFLKEIQHTHTHTNTHSCVHTKTNTPTQNEKMSNPLTD